MSIAILERLVVRVNQGLQNGFPGFEVLPRQIPTTIPEQVEHILDLERCLPDVMAVVLGTDERKGPISKKLSIDVMHAWIAPYQGFAVLKFS